LEREPTELKPKSMQGWFTPENIILGCLLVLPYASYLALLGLGGLLLWSLSKYHQAIGQLLFRQGWLWLTFGFVLNVINSYSPGESALQSLNFVPFFVFYAAVSVLIPRFSDPLRVLYRWALGLVLAAIPISLRAGVEYYFKAPANVARWNDAPWMQWLYAQPDFGHRADSVFGHPNVLANYLVLVLGLGLGLSLYYLRQPRPTPVAPWVYGSVMLMVVGVFSSGSRNGLLVVGLQIILFTLLLRPSRRILLIGCGLLAALAVGGIVWGIGGRSLTEAFSTASMRLEIWQIAFDFIPQHPWFGTGLGTFKQLYDRSLYSIPEEALKHTHNLWIMLATEAGIPLGLAFTTVVGWVVGKGVYRFMTVPLMPLFQALLGGYIIAFGGTTGFAFFDVTVYDSRLNVLGWLCLAVIQTLPTLLGLPSLNPQLDRSKASKTSYPDLLP